MRRHWRPISSGSITQRSLRPLASRRARTPCSCSQAQTQRLLLIWPMFWAVISMARRVALPRTILLFLPTARESLEKRRRQTRSQTAFSRRCPRGHSRAGLLPGMAHRRISRRHRLARLLAGGSKFKVSLTWRALRRPFGLICRTMSNFTSKFRPEPDPQQVSFSDK
ncbi:hypothetical protein D3C87_1647480 [compost metagenome]